MTDRRVFREQQAPPEVGDADVCVNADCVTERLHRPGPECNLRGVRRPGNGRRKAGAK